MLADKSGGARPPLPPGNDRMPSLEQDPFARTAHAALKRRDWATLQALCRDRIAAAPAEAEAHFLAGIAALEQKRIGQALVGLRRATELAPGRGDVAAQRARALSLAQRPAEALAEADRAQPLCRDDALSLDTLGVVYSRGNAHLRAAEAFRRAVALAPDHAGYRFNLASALKFGGDLDAAEAQYEACVALQPLAAKAHSALSQLRRQTPQRNHLARLRALLPAAPARPDLQLHLHHALAKECEDLGLHAEAFTHLLTGKRAWRATLGDVAGRDRALFEALIAAFPPGLPLAQDGGDDGASDEPIFVVGMPRSGTTLVERILSSHPQVHSAGELQNFGVALKRASGSRTRPLLDADTIARAGALDWARLGAAYLDSTRPGTGHTPRFVDKLPHNFLYLGYIARALPRAKIVCLRRDPLDTCLSNFRQLFATHTPYFDYSYDLLDTGRYYLQFERLMAHWRRVLPGRVLEIDYEAIVAAQEPSTRRLLEFCGLPWDEACLRFERNAAPVATASAVQVREPLYADAVGRWKRYEAQLAELIALLREGGVVP